MSRRSRLRDRYVVTTVGSEQCAELRCCGVEEIVAKKPWRIRFEQWLAVNGDDGMSGVTDHIAILTRVAGLMQMPGFKKALENFLDECTGLSEQKTDSVLHRLFADESIVIDACDGSRFIGDQKTTSLSFINDDFKNWELNNPGTATPSMEVSIHEMVRNATFAQIFAHLGSDLDKLCFTQNQIISFCEKHPDRLRKQGYATLFLFQEGNKFFVASVRVGSGGLCIHVNRFEHVHVWLGKDRHRLVVPQLTA